MPSVCIFAFDRPDPVYYSGETINGRIQLTTTSEKSVRSVFILFNGEAKVRWEEHKSRQVDGKTQNYTQHYRATETYLHTKTNVFNGGTLPAGTHEYTFCIPLPLQCPTSCMEKYGQISYELSLTLERKLRFDNIFKQPMTVLQHLNLNLSPEYLLPIVNEEIKEFCCFPCGSGKAILTLSIPFSGYAAGQKIKYKLEMDNQSHGYDLHGIKLMLIQNYKFTAHTPHHKTRTHSNFLVKHEGEERCLRLSKRVIEDTLLIPAVPPSSQMPGIIEVSYVIKMLILTGSCHCDEEIVLPITIGTIPLAQSATDPANAILVDQWTPQTPDTPNDDQPPSYDKYKPPSFEEATSIGERFVDTDVDEHNRIEGFVPKYPMYTNFAMPTAPSIDNIDAPDVALLQHISHASPPYPVVGPTPQALPPYPVNGINMPLPVQPNTSNMGYGWAQ